MGARLIGESTDNCELRLQAGPVGAPSVAQIQPAGREWTIALVQPNILLYFFPFEDISFVFGLILPEEYSPTNKGICQEQAEQVIDTFQIVESAS